MAINLFDANFYRAANPDLAAAGLTTDAQLLSHFQNNGLNEGRAFSPFVNLSFYRSSNPDLAAAGLTSNQQVFNHLQNAGVAEGRRFSPFVDLGFYLAANPDVNQAFAGNREQAFNHLSNSGVQEGRIFSPYEDTNFYLAANPDVNQFFGGDHLQALEHLEVHGVGEGRRFSPFVDLDFYLAANPDVNQAFRGSREQAFNHLTSYGVQEGRIFSSYEDINFYLATNPDVNQFFGGDRLQALEHLEVHGVGEGRRFSPFVDLSLYRAANPDLAALGWDNRQLFEHLTKYGVAEGRRFSIAYDSNYYRSANSDLAAANLNNTQLLQHFERQGLSEGRSSSASFNVKYYLSHNPDLGTAGFGYQQAFQHFETNGFREGRLGAALQAVSTDPGNTLNTAFSLDVLNRSRNVSEFVGTADRNDYYRFILASASNFSLFLSGLTSIAKAQLIFDSNGNGLADDSEILNSTYGSSPYSGSITSLLGAGTYFIRVYTDSSSYNTSYTLAIAATPIPTTTPRDPGNTLSTPLDIGTLSGNRSFSDFVGSTDRDDYYRFTLASASNFNLSLNGLSNSAEVQLIFDSNGNGQADSGDTLYYDYGGSNDNASITSPLGAGTYFIRVNTYSSSSNTSYTLTTSAISTTTTPRDPGNTLSTALDIGTLSGNRSFSDFVGSTDRDDYYRFTLASASNFNISLNGLSNSAEVQLIFDSNGNGQADSGDTLADEYGGINGNASITSPLGAGTYFIRVNTYSSSYNTNYNLAIAATPITTTTPRDPGNTLSTALDIGTLSGSRNFSDFVGRTDSEDYYRFSLVSTSSVGLLLNGLTADADVALIKDSNNNGVVDPNESLNSSTHSGTTAESLSTTLGSGTYYVRVYQYSGDANYNLTLTAT